jgi:dGTPase
MITAVVENSAKEGVVSMDEPTLEVMHDLRDFMFEHVYLRADAESQKDRAIGVIRDLTDWFAHHPDQVPDSYKVDETDDLTRAIDYVSGMTDRFALTTHDQLFRPTLF